MQEFLYGLTVFCFLMTLGDIKKEFNYPASAAITGIVAGLAVWWT